MSLKLVGKTSGGINAYRQTWGDGTWWEFYGEQPWKVTRHLRRALAPMDAETQSQEMAEASRTIRLEHGTIGWSWNLPISAESLDEIPSTRLLEISKVMAELHVAADMNSVGDDRKKVYSGRLSWMRRSRIFGWTFTITGRRSGQGFWHRWVRKNLTSSLSGGSRS